jgi:hypothetical protein
MELRYNPQFQKLDELIQNKALTGRAILTFGHCAATEAIIDYLAERGYQVTAILDNNEIKHGGYYKSVPIAAPAEVRNYKNDKSIVLIATRFFEQMSAQLREIGYNGQIIKLIEYNTAAEFSLTEETFSRKAERVLRGKKLLEKIRVQSPSAHLVICPLNAIGDVFVTMSFLSEYLKINQISNCIAIVNGDGCSQVTEMFGVKSVTLNDKEIDELTQATIYFHETNCILAHHDRIYTDLSIKWLNKNALTFENYYKFVILGLPKNTKQTKPKTLQAFENTLNLPKGKTLIIAPFAKSVVGVSNDFWEDIICEYKSKGFTTCTSVNGAESPLDGTMPLSFPLNQAVAAVEFAGTFIGIRSGLCDIINSAKCDKTVVFPDRYYSSTQMKLIEFWGLPNWKQIVL